MQGLNGACQGSVFGNLDSDLKQPALAELLSNFDPFPKALHEVCQRTKMQLTGLLSAVCTTAPLVADLSYYVERRSDLLFNPLCERQAYPSTLFI